MIGYNKKEMLRKISVLDNIKAGFLPQMMVVRATFYSILAGSIEDRNFDRELFSYLLILHALSKKNTYKYSTSKFSEIFENDIVHDINRALYDQRSRKAMLMQDGVVPAFVSDAIKRVGKDDFVGALCNYAIYYDIDLDNFMIEYERLEKMVTDSSIFKQKTTDFGEMCYGSDNNWAE